MNAVALLLSASIMGQAPKDEPLPPATAPASAAVIIPNTSTSAAVKQTTPKGMSPQRAEELKKTLAKKKAREAEQASVRAKKKAAEAKAVAAQQAYIEKMTPYWTALQLEQAKLALQQQRNAILASEAESLRRSAQASERFAQAIYYRSGAPFVIDPATGQMVPYGIPR